MKNKDSGTFERDRLMALLEAIPAGIAIVENPDGHISFANKKALSILGNEIYSSFSERPSKLRIYKINGTQYQPEETPASRSLRTGDSITGEEMIFLTSDGTRKVLSVSTSPLLSQDGKVEAVISVFEETTSRKEIENKLKYQSFLLNNVNDAILSVNKDMIITFWNRGAEKIYGWKEEEAVGKNSSSLLQTKYLDTNRSEIIRRAIESGEYETNVIQKNKEGNEIYIHSAFTVVTDSEGNITEFITVNRDISEKYKSELALRDSEEKFSKIFHNNPAAIIINSIDDGVIIDANEKVSEIFGYTREELNSKNFSTKHLYSEQSDREEMLRQLLEKGKVQDFEVIGIDKQGRKKNILISTEILKIKNEDFIIGSLLDITAKKETEEALKKNQIVLEGARNELQLAKEDLEKKVEQRTAMLKKTLADLEREQQRVNDVLNIIPAYVVIIDENCSIRFTNSIFLKEFGNITEFRHHDLNREDKCLDCRITAVIRSKKTQHWEWHSENGKDYEVYDFPFTDSDGSELILEMGQDITDKKNIENYVLKKIVETEEKDRRRFASDLHDDLGPTLSAIKLQLSILSSEIKSESGKELMSICDNLLSEGIEKMRNVANSILPNILESYGLETAVKSFLNKVIKDTHINYTIDSDMKDFRFDSETELHLYRITTELITNTIKHSGATEIDLMMKIKDSAFSFFYSDNGKGYRIDTDTRKITGVGLQNILNRIKLIKGKIEVVNQAGRTMVYITRKL